MREYADEIKSLEAQVSAQTRTLDNYRASGEDAQANAELAQKTAEGYEKLLSVEGQFLSNDYDDAALADADASNTVSFFHFWGLMVKKKY